MRCEGVVLLTVLSFTGVSSAQVVSDLLAGTAGRPTMTLHDFEQMASSANPTLRQASALVKRSAGQVTQAGLYPNPSIGYQGEQIRGGSYSGGEQGGFVEQTIVMGGKLGLRRKAAEEQRKTDEIGAAVQRYRVMGDVDESFYRAYAAQEMAGLRKQLLSVAEDTATTSHQLLNVGQADAPDVLEAEVEREQADLEYRTAQRAFIQSFRDLAAVAGKPELPLSRLTTDWENAPQLNEEQIVNEIVRASPEVQRAEQEVARLRAELASARRKAVPDLQIHAGVQQNFEPLNLDARGAVGVQGFATIGMAVPLFDRNQGNVSAAQAELDRAESEVLRVRFMLKRYAEPSLQTYLTDRKQVARYKSDLIPKARRAYELYLAKYREMGSPYSAVLMAQRTYFQLQVAYVQLLEELWRSAVLLQNYGMTSGLEAPAE